MLDRLRAALGALLDRAALPVDGGVVVVRLREVLVETRVAIAKLRSGRAATERALVDERRHLADAERRGRLAAGIQDQETAEIAARFAARHRERMAVLERKLEAQGAELALLEREYDEMKAQLREVERSRPVREAAWRVERARRSVAAAGGDELDGEFDRLAREAEAADRLEALKQRMGKT